MPPRVRCPQGQLALEPPTTILGRNPCAPVRSISTVAGRISLSVHGAVNGSESGRIRDSVYSAPCLRDLREPRNNARIDALGNAQRSVNANAFSRITDHDHPRLVQKEPARRFFIDLQPFRDLGDGQAGFVDVDSRVHIDSPQRLCLVSLLGTGHARAGGEQACSIVGRLVAPTRR